MPRALFAIAPDRYRWLPTDPPAVLGILFTTTIDATQSLQTRLLNAIALHSSLGCCSTIPFLCLWPTAQGRLRSTAHLCITEHIHTMEQASFQGPPGREMSPSTKHPSCYQGNLGRVNISQVHLPQGKKKTNHKPGFMHGDASRIAFPMHFFPSIRLLCSHNFQHPD